MSMYVLYWLTVAHRLRFLTLRLLHLLAPNMRLQQVTDDLASFWKTTYHQVRKDLCRRYPKHAWPENPYQQKKQ